MLSTLAMFVTGVAVVAFRRRRMHGAKVVADYSTMSRDLAFFVVVFAVAVVTGLIPPSYRSLQLVIAALLVISYFWYVLVLVREERDIEEDNEMPKCYFAPRKRILLCSDIAAGVGCFSADNCRS